MPRIAINASILDDRPTGLGAYIIDVCNKLGEQNQDNFVYSIFTASKYHLRERDNLIIRRISRFVQPAKFGKLAGLFRFAWNQLVYSFLANSYDLSYSPTPHASFFLKHQVITIHDLLALHFPQQHKMQYYYYKYFLPGLIKRAKKVVTISEATKRDIMQFYGCPTEKIHVIIEAYDNETFCPVEGAVEYVENKYGFRNFLLAVGATYPHKNMERLIEAFSLLPDDVRARHVLVIVGGREEYKKRLRSVIERMSLVQKVLLIGYVPFHDLPYLYSSARLFVYPSLYEGFGRPPLEAMACGCPVVSSDTPALTEVGGDAAHYINPYESRSISIGMAKVLDDEKRRAELVAKGFERVALFSLDRTAKELIDCFEGILCGYPGAGGSGTCYPLPAFIRPMMYGDVRPGEDDDSFSDCADFESRK